MDRAPRDPEREPMNAAPGTPGSDLTSEGPDPSQEAVWLESLEGDGRRIAEVRHPDRWTLLYRYPDGHYALYRRWGGPLSHEITWIESRGEVFSELARRLPIEDLVLLWWSLGSGRIP